MICPYCGFEDCPYQQMMPLKTFIAVYTHAHGGVSPSMREISASFKISLGNVQRKLKRLEEYGHIKRLPNRWRSIEVVW